MELKVVYSAPNRSHHYPYARELHSAGILRAFVSGFPRYSPRSGIPDLGNALLRVDQLQSLYVASLKLGMPAGLSEELAYWAKIQLDRASRGPLRDADVFIYYNGCGLESARWFKQRGGICIAEAVNSHVLSQEHILAEEHKRLGLKWRPFHRREVRRRVAELEEADYVLVPSKFVARSFITQGFPPERLLRVGYPMSTMPADGNGASEKCRDDGTFRVLYVGSVSLRKGLRYLVEAFRQLKYPKKELWIVGPIAKPSGLEDNSLPEGVKFFGPLKSEALQDVYTRATVFCLPSIEDGFGLVLIEALHYGLPVIATENTGIEDLLVDGKGGTVVPIRDAAAIAKWLNLLSTDKRWLDEKREEAAHAKARLASRLRSGSELVATVIAKCCPQYSEQLK
jgi:alpha-maltose-1-phosphate synthase